MTIKEPWASLIINGYKVYEFRGWKTNYRGRIYIYAGISMDKDMIARFKDYDIECVKEAIIGEATIVDCILIDKDFSDSLKK